MNNVDRNNFLDNAARKRAISRLQEGYAAAVKAFYDVFLQRTGKHGDSLPDRFRPSSVLPNYDWCAREQANPPEQRLLELYDRATQDEFDSILKQVDALTGVLQLGLDSGQ